MSERSMDAGASTSSGQREQGLTRPWDERDQAFNESKRLERYGTRLIFPTPLELVDDATVKSERQSFSYNCGARGVPENSGFMYVDPDSQEIRR